MMNKFNNVGILIFFFVKYFLKMKIIKYITVASDCDKFCNNDETKLIEDNCKFTY